jgi:NAD(P)H dehydrogenase (quinone)
LSRAVAVVGSSGKTGRAISAALIESGLEVRGLTRANVNLETGEGLIDAFAGCSAVYHLAPNLHPLEVEMARHVLTAAQQAGVEKLVFHSVLQPQISAMPHHVAKSRAEELVIASGLNWAILQPSAYAQNLTQSVVGALPYRASAPFSFVDLRDVALAAVRLITDEIATFGTFEASGPITSVEEVSAALGWQCAEVELAHWRAGNSALPQYQFDALTAMFSYYNEHGLAGSAFTLTELLGREPVHALDALKR